MTILDDILEASTDPSIPVSDLLRRVQIAATRLGATNVASWARGELSGYAADAVLPDYRQPGTGVMGHFTGPFQTWRNQPLTAIPDGMEHRWRVSLREPIAEIQALADEADGDPQVEWPVWDVQRYDQSRIFYIEGMGLFRAWNVVTRQILTGILDVVRTRAMEFALQLQVAYPEAGSLGGPTVAADPALAQTVYNVTTNVFGHGTNIATGPNAHQELTVVVGDEVALRERLADLGLDSDAQDEFISAIRADGDTGGPKTVGFLDRIRSGAIQLAAGLTTDVAAEILVALGRSFLGLG